ncbi:4-(cytidine 5'-diphospho)-2-C-methyl-D-erythritol kinase, partial [Treponema endosymbiont of Eucomonympha sp.]|uniref:4-(cytidine 5'-diphospho)-2-C-methyl-D-erythritol kinase n=1 Tax=Treponema endosymbiont of Eucomonympha sp. TaxID=1580831 RepID=UPI001650B276
MRVLRGRQNGYHNIESIFQTIPFYDELTVAPIRGHGACEVDCRGLELPGNNTFTRAYRGFCEETGIDASVRVTVEKRIPQGAGLGGGSSDAASFIRTLNALFKTEPDIKRSTRIASGVGSDVFFFLSCGEGGGCALVTGRGEQIKPIARRTDLCFVVVCPDVQSGTAEAYRLVDEWHESTGESPCPSLADLEAMYYQPASEWAFVNSFAAPLIQQYPLIGEALEDLAKAGASFTQMSGSGAAVFGVFESG